MSVASANDPPKNFLCSAENETDTFFFSTNEDKVTLETDGNIIQGGQFEITEKYYFFHIFYENINAKFQLNRYSKILSLYVDDEIASQWPDNAKCELIEKSL